jgi:hypothetical protein
MTDRPENACFLPASGDKTRNQVATRRTDKFEEALLLLVRDSRGWKPADAPGRRKHPLRI